MNDSPFAPDFDAFAAAYRERTAHAPYTLGPTTSGAREFTWVNTGEPASAEEITAELNRSSDERELIFSEFAEVLSEFGPAVPAELREQVFSYARIEFANSIDEFTSLYEEDSDYWSALYDTWLSLAKLVTAAYQLGRNA